MRDVISETLIEDGYAVVTASDAEQALALFREQQPDLAIIDILMPGKTGIALLKEIREELRGESLHAILLTNYNPSDPAFMAPALKGNPEYYLIKSDTSMEVLLERVHMSLGETPLTE